MPKLIVLIVILLTIQESLQNEKDVENKINDYAKVASSFLKSQNAESLGGIIQNLVQSEGGKQLSDMLMNLGSNENSNHILQALGSIIGKKNTDSSGFDPSIITNVLNIVNSLDTDNENETPQNKEMEDESDSPDILSTLNNFLGQEGGMDSLMSFLPMIMSTVNSFTEKEPPKRVVDHSDHEMFWPPVLEKIHVGLDHLMNSEFGRSLMQTIGTEKFFKVFANENGKFNFDKFVELLENHSFRKHWIELVTRKVAGTITYFTDPKTQTSYLARSQFLFNSFLKSQGYPKVTMFDPLRPTESLTALVNHVFKQYFNYKVNAKEYVKPAVVYVQDLLKLTQRKSSSIGKEIDSTELSHKLADTINLEVIEPVARVYRAYRFAKKNPKCDKYVMCLVNHDESQDVLSLPGLKNNLSKYTSAFASWFLSKHTGTPFWSLFSIIMEKQNCQILFKKTCNDFHIEEIKVTTEYVHNEL